MRTIDPVMNERAVERIKLTFDSITSTVDGPAHALPEWAAHMRGQPGDYSYGISDTGVEGICIASDMGPAIIYRDGTVEYPDGLEEPDLPDTACAYDRFYATLTHFMRPSDLPDKIVDPLDDEIDVEEGFAAPDENGEEVDEEELMPSLPPGDEEDDFPLDSEND